MFKQLFLWKKERFYSAGYRAQDLSILTFRFNLINLTRLHQVTSIAWATSGAALVDIVAIFTCSLKSAFLGFNLVIVLISSLDRTPLFPSKFFVTFR